MLQQRDGHQPEVYDEVRHHVRLEQPGPAQGGGQLRGRKWWGRDWRVGGCGGGGGGGVGGLEGLGVQRVCACVHVERGAEQTRRRTGEDQSAPGPARRSAAGLEGGAGSRLPERGGGAAPPGAGRTARPAARRRTQPPRSAPACCRGTGQGGRAGPRRGRGRETERNAACAGRAGSTAHPSPADSDLALAQKFERRAPSSRPIYTSDPQRPPSPLPHHHTHTHT